MVRRSEHELIQQLLHGQDDRNWSSALARLRFVPEAFPPRTHNADFVARVVLPVPSSDFTSTQPQEGSNGNSNSGRFEQNLKHLENFDGNYWRSTQPTTKTIGWSLTKSLISALVGIAIADGKIGSVNDAVTQYVPELKGSAYDVSGSKTFYRCRRVPLGTRNYSDWKSDINRFARTFALGSSLDHFIITLKREHTPGTYHRYNSMDTQVLGSCCDVRPANRMPIISSQEFGSLLECKMMLSGLQMTRARSLLPEGLNATLRDFAKLGQLYLHRGSWNGQQVVPSAGVMASVTPDAPI